jgi:hypothetical protein
MNQDFWNKIYYGQHHKTRFKKRRKGVKSMCDIIYKPWPVPMCKCSDCKQARKPPSRINRRKYFTRNYLFGYPKVEELEPSIVIRFYEMFIDRCPYKKDVFEIIHKYDAKWCWVNDEDYISICLIPSVSSELLEELTAFINNVNATDFYSKYRFEWSEWYRTSTDPDEYAITLRKQTK